MSKQNKFLCFQSYLPLLGILKSNISQKDFFKSYSLMKNNIFLFLTACMYLALQSCTKEITVDLPTPKDKIVVEGSIEVGQPPFILLTKNAAFFGGLNFNDLGAYFVHDVDQIMIYTDAGDTTQLQEFCISDPRIAAAFGYDFGSGATAPEICIYTIPDILNWTITGVGSLLGEENTNYHLYIKKSDKLLTASTYIPNLYPFDSLQVRPHPDAGRNDSLAGIYLYLTFPSGNNKYVRLQSSTNGSPYYTSSNGSVFEYKVFFGASIGLPLAEGRPSGVSFNRDRFGYFLRGDTIDVKWSQIDKGVFDFYSTLEADGGDGPFSSPVKIISNVNGGLGIWAGYASSYKSIIIPK
jgi:hypothetical protein